MDWQTGKDVFLLKKKKKGARGWFMYLFLNSWLVYVFVLVLYCHSNPVFH